MPVRHRLFKRRSTLRRGTRVLRGAARRRVHDAAAGPLKPFRTQPRLPAPTPSSNSTPSPPDSQWLMSADDRPLMITIDCTISKRVEVVDLTGPGPFDPDCFVVEIVFKSN